MQRLKEYFVVGGLPEVVSTYCANKENKANAYSIVRTKQEELIHSYMSDFSKYSGKVRANEIAAARNRAQQAARKAAWEANNARRNAMIAADKARRDAQNFVNKAGQDTRNAVYKAGRDTNNAINKAGRDIGNEATRARENVQNFFGGGGGFF